MRAEPKIVTALSTRRERIEAFDELAHDAEHAPRVGPREVDARACLLKELLIFSHGACIADRVVDDASVAPTFFRRPATEAFCLP